MKKDKKKLQLRACSICKKHGHNKARCPVLLSKKNKLADSSESKTIKMVLYEKISKVSSPHILNLKSNKNPWSEVYTFSPPDTSQNTSRKERKEKKLKNNLKISFQPEKESFFQAIFNNIILKYRQKTLEKILKLEEQRQDQKEKEIIFNKKITKKSVKEKIEKIKIKKSTKKNIPTAHLSIIEPEVKITKKINFNRLFLNQDNITRLTFQIATVIIICLVIPLQTKSYYQSVKNTTVNIASAGTEGFMALQESTTAILASDVYNAENAANQALSKFESAILSLEKNHQFLQKIISVVPIVSSEVQSRQKLITAGQKIASGNKFLIQGLNKSQENNDDSLTQRVKILTNYLKTASPNYQAALDDLAEISQNVLPLEYQTVFNDFRSLFTTFLNDLNNIIDLGVAINEIFGGEGLRRYLIVFQNEHEIRPTGGFIGSFALIDVKDGKIINLEIPAGGSYDLQGQLDVLLEPPAPLLLANKRWEFQDANWFADFPATAEKLLWFYRHARQVTADGVIAINASVLERLLSILGPISDEKRDMVFTEENAILELQKIVEEGSEKKNNQPKQIITDLAPQILLSIFTASAEKTMPLVVNLSEALEKKEIQAYFTDSEVQETIKSFGWSGQILPTTLGQDYLLVVNTNIQGQKTDAKIVQDISHQVVVEEDGTITNTVVITRKHLGLVEQKTLYGSANIDYIRVYVPQDSKLVSAGGFIWPDEKLFRAPFKDAVKDSFLNKYEIEVEIDKKTGTRITNEFGKTAFGNWLIVQPGETQQIYFTYELPFKLEINKNNGDEKNIIKKIISDNPLTSRYQLILQKQSGVNSTFDSQIIYPLSWYPSWVQGNNIVLANNGIKIDSFKLETDQIWSLLMRNN